MFQFEKFARVLKLAIIITLFSSNTTLMSQSDTNAVKEIENKIKLTPFHNIGWNLLNAVAYNYGANFIGAGLGTWAMIETGFDWEWRNMIYNNYSLTSSIGPAIMYVGGVVPAITPLVFYFSGKHWKDEKAIITAKALTQTLLLTLGVQSTLKAITGRPEPGLIDDLFGYTRLYDVNDFSDKFDLFNMNFIDGWPSGHTANAFSTAATLSEIYHDNTWVKVGAYTYATLMGLGTTLTSHWISEAFAGALIGYAIGKSVGKSYRKFLNNEEDKNKISFYCTSNSIGVIIRW